MIFKHSIFKIYLALTFLIVSVQELKAIYVPVSLTGFNADVVADIPGNAAASTSADYDGVNYVFMSSSFNPTGSYIPNGGLISSVVASTPGLTYQLASYTANNTLRMPGTSSGVLSFVTPQSAQTVFVLGSTGSGIGNATITVTFTDLTTQVFTGITFPDWYNGANFAIQGMGRTNRVTNVISNDASNPRLYQAPLALLASNYGKLIQSVSFSNTGGVLNIMAISIDSPPIPCSGTPVAGTAIASAANPCPGVNVTVNLSGSTLASGLAYQWLQGTNCTGPWVSISGVTNPSALTPSLTISAIGGTTRGYRCRITCTNNGFVDTSTSACVVVQPWTCTSPCYGASTATSTADQDILNVSMASLNNTTTCAAPLTGSQGNAVGDSNRYANFIGSAGVPSPTVYAGLPQTFSVTVGTCGANVASSVKMYIDFNHNAVFTDLGEEVYSNASIPSVNPAVTVSGTFTTPLTALTGCTRLRVVMMSTSVGTINPTGTYGFGETEDYTINIIQPTQYDPAISILNVPPGNCFSNSETVVATLCNYGTSNINVANNNVSVTLRVTGPTGAITNYTVPATTGILGSYGSGCIPVTFTGVNLYAGGNYALNTMLTITGLSNGTLQNDSLNSPITRLNYRPTGGPDYQLCQGSIIPFGQGLLVSGCATPINDSIEMTFNIAPGQPPMCTSTLAAPSNACEFASGILPVLPFGSSFTAPAVLTVTNLASASLGCVTCVWPSEKRFSLFQGIAPPTTASNTFFPGVQGNTATTGSNAQGYTYTNTVSQSILGTIYSVLGGGNTLKLGSWNTFNTTANNHVMNYNGNTTVAKLKIYFTYVPANFQWYNTPVGGSVLYTYSPFNPMIISGSGITNSNTPGTTTFYASCAGSSDCRIPVNLVINPTPTVVQDTFSKCEYAQGSNSAVFDLTTLNGPVSAFNPAVTVSYFGDQSMFLPINTITNDTSSTNFIYSRVTYPTTGCFSSDSILLKVNSIPQFISSPLVGNACAPSCIDVASLINPFTTTAGADTLYYSDPACTIPYPNPHCIFVADTVYMVLVTNTNPYCADTAEAQINIVPSTNFIVNQDTMGNFSNCGSVGCASILMADGNTETLYTTTDCRKIVTIKDLPDGIHMGTTSVCEDIDCSVQFHNGQPYVNRHYQIVPSNNDSAEVCLYYLQQDFDDYNSVAFTTSWPMIDPTVNLCIAQVDNGDITTPGHTALSIPTSAITSTYDPLTTVWKVCFKVDSFSYFYCHACNPLNIVLPVTLVNFTGKRVDGITQLKWNTSQENNFSHFIVERSKDLKHFTPISSAINSKASDGNSAIELNYAFNDLAPFNGHNYYRLLQVDIDGHQSQSDVVDVYVGNDSKVTLFPNPVSAELHITITTQKAIVATAKIMDAAGRVLRTIQMNAQVGESIHTVDMQSLSVGIYLISITDGEGLDYMQTIRKK